MRKQVKARIMELLDTLGDGLEYLYQLDEKPQQILFDCAAAVEVVYDTIETSSSDECPLLSLLEQLHDIICETVENWDVCGSNTKYQQMKMLYSDICFSAKQDLKVHIEIAFMPYKFAMWDSLESIWYSAIEDDRCECYLVPIPYFDRNLDGTLGTMHDESYLFLSMGEVTHYSKYTLESRRPDIIYVHNPYDEYNYVTSVHSDYYSEELKKYTDCLVYVPYFIAGHYYNEYDMRENLELRSYKNFNYVVSQSENYDQVLKLCGVSKKQILPFGNPKFDAFQLRLKMQPVIPDEWLEIVADKKVFLLNTTIGHLLRTPTWSEKIREMIETVTGDSQAALIWRPHPLLRQTLLSMRPELMHQFEDLLQYARESPNIIIDEGENPYPSMVVADALISEYSSLVFQFLNTGKPVFSLSSKSNLRNVLFWTVDWYAAYFEQDGMSLLEFVNIVMKNKDDRGEQRVRRIRKSLYYSNRTSGERIHKYLASMALSASARLSSD